jgi:hypothetical protein
MPRNGSGQYDLPYNWNDDKANGIKVLASRMQAQDQDIANALTGSLSSDGQTPLTGNLDFNGNKCVDLVDGTDAGDSVNVSQVQTGELQFFGVSTTTPAGTNGLNYDLGPTPSILVYPDYVRFSFVCHFTCIDNPNVRFGTLSTKTLKKSNGSGGYTALEAGDMVANKEYVGVLNADINAADIIIENVENNNTSSSVQSGTSQARTIATGAIPIKSNFSSYTVDTEGSVATDDLDTITGGRNGQIIYLLSANIARSVILKSGTGNIIVPYGGNLALSTTTPTMLRYDGTNWRPIAVQNIVRTTVSSVSTVTTQIPFDDTIPQNTEGTEVMSLAITPTSQARVLKVDVVCNLANSSGAAACTAALFQDSTADALAAAAGEGSASGQPFQIIFTAYVTAGSTSPTTFKVRVGPGTATTLTFNGSGGARRYGGVMASSITITELLG